MMLSKIAINPNLRVGPDQFTIAGLEDVTGPIAVGSQVEVYEPVSRLVGRAFVVEIDQEDQTVLLAVDWATLVVSGNTSTSPLNLPVETNHRIDVTKWPTPRLPQAG